MVVRVMMGEVWRVRAVTSRATSQRGSRDEGRSVSSNTTVPSSSSSSSRSRGRHDYTLFGRRLLVGTGAHPVTNTQ